MVLPQKPRHVRFVRKRDKKGTRKGRKKTACGDQHHRKRNHSIPQPSLCHLVLEGLGRAFGGDHVGGDHVWSVPDSERWATKLNGFHMFSQLQNSEASDGVRWRQAVSVAHWRTMVNRWQCTTQQLFPNPFLLSRLMGFQVYHLRELFRASSAVR